MEVLTYPGMKPINWAHPPSATTRVASDLICGDGVRFTGSMRTVCHMAQLIDDSAHRFGAPLHVIQPPYHTGVGVSEGTHNLDACSDLYPPPGVTFPTFSGWLRARGFDGWWRHTGDWANPADWHYHGFTHPASGITFATPVGLFVDGGISTLGHLASSSQIADYMVHAFGLEGMHTPGSDDSWYPKDPHAVAFNLAHFIKAKQEETMEYKDWSAESKRELAADIASALVKSNTELLGRKVNVRTPNGADVQQITIKQAIARGANGPAVTRLSLDQAVADITADDQANG